MKINRLEENAKTSWNSANYLALNAAQLQTIRAY